MMRMTSHTTNIAAYSTTIVLYVVKINSKIYVNINIYITPIENSGNSRLNTNKL